MNKTKNEYILISVNSFSQHIPFDGRISYRFTVIPHDGKNIHGILQGNQHH